MNKRNNATDQAHIQTAHDAAVGLGAKCQFPTYEASARHSRADYERIQEMHDITAGLGAVCNQENAPGVLTMMGREGTLDTGQARRVLRHLEADDKIEKAIGLLTRSGYSTAEAKKIATFIFGKKKR